MAARLPRYDGYQPSASHPVDRVHGVRVLAVHADTAVALDHERLHLGPSLEHVHRGHAADHEPLSRLGQHLSMVLLDRCLQRRQVGVGVAHEVRLGGDDCDLWMRLVTLRQLDPATTQRWTNA